MPGGQIYSPYNVAPLICPGVDNETQQGGGGGGGGKRVFWVGRGRTEWSLDFLGVYSLFYIGKEFFWHHKFQWAHDPFCFLANYFLTDTSFRRSMRCF